MPGRLQERSVVPAEELEPPAAIRLLFGSPPLIDGENVAAYEAFAEQVRAAVAPADNLEEIWVRDIIDVAWEVQRARLHKAKYLQSLIHDALTHKFERHFSYDERSKYERRWKRRDPATMKIVKQKLKERGVDPDEVAAEAYTLKIKSFEKIDRLIALAEARRNAALRELERRRDALARRLQNATQIIEDAEFREVAPALESLE